uniref:Gypsy retrotransposon integrase-like protein 1 n=1 Tax=Nothobranchius kadleci TaxID=1051664 RepID=A0A1A8CXN4_NOTKA
MSDEEAGASATATQPRMPLPHQQANGSYNANVNSPPNATFTIQPPEQFDFSKPQQWEKWIRRFERFRLASNLHLSSEANQVNTLIYCMGDEADDILRGQALSDIQRQQYQAVRDALDTYFVPRKNIIYERARFNQRTQQANEAVDSFVTALYALAENCGYGALHDELIRDRLVVGLRDISLAERLQMDKDLTLEKAVNQARQSEVIKKQQTDIRGENKLEIDAVTAKHREQKRSTFKPRRERKHTTTDKTPNGRSCYRCGKTPAHGKGQCPAKETICHSCGKRGHFSKVCKSVKSVHVIETEECDDTPVFLGSVDAGSDPWFADLTIRNHKVRFKIDTGADVSVIPAQMYYCINQNETGLCEPDRPLFGPGGTPLDVLGMSRETICKGEQEIQENVYVIKNLHIALLSRPASVKLNLVCRADCIDMNVLNENYPKLCQGLGLMQQPYTIKLKPNAVPFSLATPRRVPIPLLGKVKRELERMESMGVISRVEEPTEWCAGMVPVPTKNDSVRICVDLTHLNEAVCREKYILPSVEQTLGSLAGAKVFSKLDANRGFWQVPLSPESAHYTTFITPFGRFYFNRLPFGIASAPEHFQRRMSVILNGLPGVVCHMDDILIWGQDQQEHNARLHTVLNKLQEAGVTLNLEKCDLSKQEVKFLGHVLSAAGVQPDPEKIRAVTAMKEPSNISEVRSFLGMVNQLGKFIPGLAEKDKPLRDLLSKKNQWVWSCAQQKAFNQLKGDLTSTPILALYDPNKELKLSADASSYGLGAVLFQQEGEQWRPVAYASRSLTETEQRYAQVEKEALGLTWGCERFKDFLIGRHFSLETDHKPLVSLLGQQALTELPPRIQRFRLRLMRYSYTISHIPGKEILTADALSRAPVDHDPDSKATAELLEDTNIYVEEIVKCMPATPSYITQLREQLKTDSICSDVMAFCQSSWPEYSHLTGPIKAYWPHRDTLTVHDNLLLKGTRLVIPTAMRHSVLIALHEGHQGMSRCRERARETVWWPGLSGQINDLVKNCTICIKERTNPVEPLMPSQLPERPWQKVGADLFTFNNSNYVLLVDYYSKFVEIAKLTPTRSEDVIVHLKSIFSRHGIPELLYSDNGPQFSSQQFKDFAAAYGFMHVTSSPGFAQSNGEAERHVQTVKSLLKKAKDPYLALLAYRATPLANGYSPAQLLMGRRLRTPVPQLPSLLNPSLPNGATVLTKARERVMKDSAAYNRRHRVTELPPLSPGQPVWITDTRREGTVISSHSTPRSYIVETPSGAIRRNRHHLQPLPDATPKLQTPSTPVRPTENALLASNLSAATTLTPKIADAGPVRTRAGRVVIKPQRLDL